MLSLEKQSENPVLLFTNTYVCGKNGDLKDNLIRVYNGKHYRKPFNKHPELKCNLKKKYSLLVI